VLLFGTVELKDH